MAPDLTDFHKAVAELARQHRILFGFAVVAVDDDAGSVAIVTAPFGLVEYNQVNEKISDQVTDHINRSMCGDIGKMIAACRARLN